MISGILSSGSGILFSIPFTNSTFAISTRLFPLDAVTLIVTFLIATCFPIFTTTVPSASIVAVAPLLLKSLIPFDCTIVAS